MLYFSGVYPPLYKPPLPPSLPSSNMEAMDVSPQGPQPPSTPTTPTTTNTSNNLQTTNSINNNTEEGGCKGEKGFKLPPVSTISNNSFLWDPDVDGDMVNMPLNPQVIKILYHF